MIIALIPAPGHEGLTAEGPMEWSAATRDAGRALVPQLRASIVASFAGAHPDLRKAG